MIVRVAVGLVMLVAMFMAACMCAAMLMVVRCLRRMFMRLLVHAQMSVAARMPAAVRILLCSLRRAASRPFALFKTLFFGVANVTHSGFLGRFVV
jgi:hypothetical protein